MNRKKVILILPNSETHYVVPPIGLGYLANSLRKNNHNPIIIDGIKENLTLAKLDKIIEKEKPDIVGIEIFSCDLNTAIKYFNLVRNKYPNILLVTGGPHVSGVKEEIFKEIPILDFAFQGEAELGFPLLLKELSKKKKNLKKIPGLIYKEKNTVKSNLLCFEKNLDKLGPPAWDLMKPNKYPKIPQGALYKNYPIAPIITSRGCPYHCTYCAGHTTTGRIIRKRSIKNVMEEIEFLIKNYGIKELHIIDDNFTQDKKRVHEFCNEYMKRKLKLTIAFPNGVRLDTLDEETLKLLKKCGCYHITLGIESGTQKILNDMKKGLKISTIKEKVNLINKIGIDITAFFIIGYPTETKGTIENTIKLAKSLKIKRAHFSTFLPLPSAEATQQLIQNGSIKNFNWSNLFYSEAPYSPPGMTTKELKKLQRKAFFSFYLRPKIIFFMLKEIKSFQYFKSLLKRAIDYAF